MATSGLWQNVPKGFININGENISLQDLPAYNERQRQQSLIDYEKSLQDKQAKQALDNKYGFGSSSTGGNQSSTASIGIGGIGGIDDITKQAKDLAQFRLGLDFQQMDKSALLREQESANNFGRTTKLTDQTKGWERLINTDTQDAITKRNTDTLTTQKDMQNTGINQENFAARRAIGLASRRLGG